MRYSLEYELSDNVRAVLELVVHILQEDTDHLDDRDQQGAKRQRPQMVPGIEKHQRSAWHSVTFTKVSHILKPHALGIQI